MTAIHIVKEKVARNQYGEKCGMDWEVIFYCGCVEHYPKSRQGVTGDIVTTPNGEVVENYEIVWIETCACKCIDLCETDIRVGQFAYLMKKPWKIVGITFYDDCGCNTIKLILDRLDPREEHRKLKECVSCFDVGGC
jgi:hypothetical protein